MHGEARFAGGHEDERGADGVPPVADRDEDALRMATST